MHAQNMRLCALKELCTRLYALLVLRRRKKFLPQVSFMIGNENKTKQHELFWRTCDCDGFRFFWCAGSREPRTAPASPWWVSAPSVPWGPDPCCLETHLLVSTASCSMDELAHVTSPALGGPTWREVWATTSCPLPPGVTSPPGPRWSPGNAWFA